MQAGGKVCTLGAHRAALAPEGKLGCGPLGGLGGRRFTPQQWGIHHCYCNTSAVRRVCSRNINIPRNLAKVTPSVFSFRPIIQKAAGKWFVLLIIFSFALVFLDIEAEVGNILEAPTHTDRRSKEGRSWPPFRLVNALCSAHFRPGHQLRGGKNPPGIFLLALPVPAALATNARCLRYQTTDGSYFMSFVRLRVKSYTKRDFLRAGGREETSRGARGCCRGLTSNS